MPHAKYQPTIPQKMPRREARRPANRGGAPAAIKTILKRYGSHDKKGAEVWLQEFESELRTDRTALSTGKTMSQQQAEFLADLAVGLVSQDPKEAQQLGLLSQVLMGQFYSFLISRAMAIVARNSPDRLALLQSNVSELAQGISIEQRQQADTLASLADQRTALLNGNDADIESRIHRAEQEKNSSTRNFLLRNLVIQLMRRDPEQALDVTKKIDDVDLRAQAEDDVYLVMLQNAFRGASYDEAKRLALRLNDINRRAQWLAQVATQVSSRTKDRAEVIDLLSEAYSIAAKGDNTPAKLEVLLFIAKEFVLLDRERGFDILSEAAETANRLKKPEPKTNTPSRPVFKVITMTVVNGKEVSTDDTATLDSIDFSQIIPFTERDYLRTSLVGDTLKDRSLRAKYFIALARNVLHVPRQGPGYERTLEDILSGSK